MALEYRDYHYTMIGLKRIIGKHRDTAYIGSAKKPKKRCDQHRSDGKVGIFYHSKFVDDMKLAEQELIDFCNKGCPKNIQRKSARSKHLPGYVYVIAPW